MRITIAFLFSFAFQSAMAQSIDSVLLVLGKVSYTKNELFVEIPAKYASRSDMYLRRDALNAFVEMRNAASEAGVDLKVISAARSFNHQKRIWEAKWSGNRLVAGKNLRTAIPDVRERALEILKYSSMPGTSRHHWGTDIDINSLSPVYFESGSGKKEFEWLRDNAHLFGFCQTYTVKGAERPDGYEEEKWHWTYVPIASKLLDYYNANITEKHITGFDGADALPFSEISKYVFGISESCKKLD